ncbi:MAG: hypothetical protein AB7T49_05400 [Oligoflexales bacterium]
MRKIGKKTRIVLTLAMLALLGIDFAHHYIESTNVELEDRYERLSYLLLLLKEPKRDEISVIEQKVRDKALLYDHFIQEKHLWNGMVVNRDNVGKAMDTCDSLLFSSLRYVALSKLGLAEEAAGAWQQILGSSDQGRWFRHPKCKNKEISRDMMVGLAAALSVKPEGWDLELQKLIAYANDNEGYFSPKRNNVSYMSPELVSIFSMLSKEPPVSLAALPGFTTQEWEIAFSGDGYENHLIAMKVWLQMELAEHNKRKLTSFIGRLIFFDDELTHKAEQNRLKWVTENLFQKNPDNVFFQYLFFRSQNLLTNRIRSNLLLKLDDERLFPDDRLPADCDRKADYLWQRRSEEYSLRRKKCYRQFAGVDYLWMASLLLDTGDEGPSPLTFVVP